MSDNLDLDAQIMELQKGVSNSMVAIIQAQEAANAHQVMEQKLRDEEAAIMKQAQEIKNRRTELQREYQEKQKVVKRLRLEELERNRQLQKLLNEKQLQNNYRKLSDELDRETANRPWRGKAKTHQITGGKHLASAKRAILGDKRGLGKTLTSLIYMDMVRAKKTIIFTPKDVSLNFESEIKRWTPDRPVIVLTGSNQIARNTMLTMMASVPEITVVINYEAWRRDASLVQRLIDVNFDTIVIDEAHKIKKHTGVAYSGIYELVYATNQCPICGSSQIEPDRPGKKRHCSKCLYEEQDFYDFRSIKNVVPMTGTTFINKPQDIWPLLNLIDTIHYGNLNNFLHDYCTMDLYTQHWKFKIGGEERLTKALGSKYIGRTPQSAGVEMPPQTPQHHYITFDPKTYPRQWKVMEQIRQYAAIKMAENVAMPVVGRLAELTRLAQAITWPGGIKIFGKKPDRNGMMVEDRSVVLYESDAQESIKIDKAIELIQQGIDEGDRIILFSRFREALKELEIRINELGISVVRYDGSINDGRAREAQLDFDIKSAANHGPDEKCNDQCPNWTNIEMGFCKGYKYQVFLGQYQKAGTGLNLTGARQMVILDRYYADAYEDQAMGRIQRLDSTMPTIVHIITVVPPEGTPANRQTVDQWMDALIEEKKAISQGYERAHLESDMMKAFANGDII